MKQAFIIFFTALLFIFSGQQLMAKAEGNTSGKSSPPIPHDTCLNKKFSIVFYLMQDSLYSLPNNPQGDPGNYLITYSLNTVISTLNNVFSRICVSFENCKTVIIPNFEYNNWTKGVTDVVVASNWSTDKTINIYIPAKSLLVGPISPDVYAYSSAMPSATYTPPQDFIVLYKGFYLSTNTVNVVGSNLIHAMGEFFGLPHTFAEISTGLPNGPTTELANGVSNCSTNGDGFCDTEADCWPVVGAADANGQYYLVPRDNFMSLYDARCRFTQEQYNYMAHIIATSRLYLH